MSAEQSVSTAAEAAVNGLTGTGAGEAVASSPTPPPGAGAGDALTSGAGDALGSVVSTLGQPEALISWGGYFQALAILFLIIALLFALLWLLKHKGGLKRLTSQGELTLESRLTLGPKKHLIVVRFLNKRVLLGLTDQRITMLTELPPHEDDIPHPEPDPENIADFKAQLDRASHDSD